MWFRTLLDSLKPGRSDTPIHKAPRGAPRRRPAACRLALEALEDRCVPASLAVSDFTLLEGNSGAQNAVVTVTLSAPTSRTVTVNYNTADGTALAGSDYQSVAGKLTFAKGVTSKTIQVAVIGDGIGEPDESFRIQLANAKGATIANGTAVVTILDDDQPRISVSDVAANEGNDGPTAFTFTVSLSVAYDLPVTVYYTTMDGSASAGIDYTAAAGTLVFAPGQTSQTITVAVNGDRLVESDKMFSINVSTPNRYAGISKGVGVGTIIDDEPRISISDDISIDRTLLFFYVRLSAVCEEAVTVNFATVDGTGIAGVNYLPAYGTLTFAPGERWKEIMVWITPTTYSYSFYVHLSGASTNALISDEWANGSWYYSPPEPYEPSTY